MVGPQVSADTAFRETSDNGREPSVGLQFTYPIFVSGPPPVLRLEDAVLVPEFDRDWFQTVDCVSDGIA